MRPLLFSAALTVALAGCAPPGFDRLGPFTMELSDAWDVVAEVTFTYDQQTQGCQTLDEDFSVEVDGVAAEEVWRGRSSWDGTYARSSCSLPWAWIPKAGVLGVTSTITASTGGDTVVAEVADMGSNLPAHPILAPGESVHAGQLVRLAVDPGFDRVQWPSEAVVSVQNGSDFQSRVVPISPPSEAGVLEVQLPSTMPAGSTEVKVAPTIRPTILRCEGAGGCSLHGTMEVNLSVQLSVVP